MKHISVFYFDFESSTNGPKHVPYCVCLSNADGSLTKSFYGQNCARKFLDYLPDKSLCYAHNLSYDINFVIDLLDSIEGKSIIKGSKVYLIKGRYSKKVLTFKDSLCIIPSALKEFPAMFNLDCGRKECFPYNYYQSFIQKIKYFDEDSLMMKESNVFTVPGEIGIIKDAIKYIKPEDEELFKENVKAVAYLDDIRFSMKRYAIFYCAQDVNILRDGFETFRKLLLEQFELDAYDYISISSIANKLMKLRCYIPNGNLYELANKPRDFISKAIIGGRCMLSDNQKRIITGDIVDFDAVSLYPSSIARLYLLEGYPKVLSKEMLNQEYLIKHLFTDEQLKPKGDRFISGFFIQAKIIEVKNPLHFPIIVGNNSNERATNEPTEMYMDHITFEDLIRFQKCNIQVIRGYYYDGNRDIKCREVIKDLFDLRNHYKSIGNPLQIVIKLLLNSIYGKTILKPIDTKLKFINSIDKDKYIKNHIHSIHEMSGYDGGRKIMIKELKPYNKHFTLCSFGVNILSMSKRIMCEVMCCMEEMCLDIFYTDTDSFFTYKNNLEIIAKEFENRYKRQLIGTQLGQFHPDLEPINGDKNVIGTKGIFVMKKCYIVQLVNSRNEIAFHVRMKGIPSDVIVNRANELYKDSIKCSVRDGLIFPIDNSYVESRLNDFSVMKLYKDLYDGKVIEFDLVMGNHPRFDIKIGTTQTKTSFIRRIGLNVN